MTVRPLVPQILGTQYHMNSAIGGRVTVRPLLLLVPQILNTQYRMNPAISRFPSKHFYGGKLLDGEVRGAARVA